jgi:hypothetical protein
MKPYGIQIWSDGIFGESGVQPHHSHIFQEQMCLSGCYLHLPDRLPFVPIQISDFLIRKEL